MRKPVSPWSIRGVGHEVRAQAAKAAGRKRLYLGEWVSQAILAAAEAELGTAPRTVPSPKENPPEGLAEAMQALNGRLESAEDSAKTLATLADRLESLESRLGVIECRQRSLAKLTERLVEEQKTTNMRLGVLARSLSLILNRTGKNGTKGDSGESLDRKVESLAELVLRLAQRKNGCGETAAASAAESRNPKPKMIVPGSTEADPIYSPGFGHAGGGHQKEANGIWGRVFGPR